MERNTKTKKGKGRKDVFFLGFVLGICTAALFIVTKQNVESVFMAEKEQVLEAAVIKSEKEQMQETLDDSQREQESSRQEISKQETSKQEASTQEASKQQTSVHETSKQEIIIQERVILDVPYINQRERYPTGCESVSTVMALNYLGINITVDDFIDNYLNMGTLPTDKGNGEKIGCDPWKAFPGSPYSIYGYGCFAPVIVNALDKFIDKNKYDIKELYDVSIEELCSKYIDNNIPVIFWATSDMKPTRAGNTWIVEDTGKRINWVAPMHCLLLVGYDKDFYYFNDPQQSKAYAYKKSNVEAAYIGMFSQTVVVLPKSFN